MNLRAFRHAGSGFEGCFAKMCVGTSLLSYGLLSFDKNQVGGRGRRSREANLGPKGQMSDLTHKNCVR